MAAALINDRNLSMEHSRKFAGTDDAAGIRRNNDEFVCAFRADDVLFEPLGKKRYA